MVSRTITLLLLFTLTLIASVSEAATITVNSTSDVLLDDGFCTLREAVIASNTDTPSGGLPGECISGSGTDTIALQSANYILTIAGTGEDDALTGDLDLLDSVEILGGGMDSSVIDGNDLDRVFDIDVFPDINVVIADLTIRDGATTGAGGGILNRETLELERVSLVSNSAGSSGGAVYSPSGEMSLTDSLVTENSAGGNGGGIYSNSLSGIVRSIISSNTAGAVGGGLATDDTMNITDSTIAFNTSGDGGGIWAGFSSILTLSKSTITSNIASNDGGGIFGQDTITISNSTVSGNSAVDFGAGIYGNGSVDIRNSTVHANSSNQGSAIYNLETVFAANVVVSGTCAGTDTLLSLGGNIESPGDTCGLAQASDQTAVTSQALNLGPLAENGGLTLTHAPVLPSVAIDTGVNGSCLSVDQRGVQRPQDGDGNGSADCDVGSVELVASGVTIFSDGFESGDTSAWSSSVP